MLEFLWENEQEKIEFEDIYAKTCKEAACATLSYEGHSFSCEVYLLFTDDDEIRTINFENRGIDRATDVLSFPLIDADRGKLNITDSDIVDGKVILGDIVISLERAVLQSEEYGHSLLRELAFLTVHSMLHLLGYDHVDDPEGERIMIEKQDTVLSNLGITRDIENF